jgi:RNA polymerase sigma-70 factor (ECF subfamily)
VGLTPPDAFDVFSDEVLVALVLVLLAGESDEAWSPFEALYRRHVQEVLKTVYRFLLKHFSILDLDLSWQLTQETFLVAWEHLPKKNPKSPFLPWIKVIAVNQARQHMRRIQRERSITDEVQYPPDDVTLLDQSPEEQLVVYLSSVELRSKIERVKQRLPPQLRQVFILHYEQGRTIPEIARELGIKTDSASQYFWRANLRFKEEWARDTGEPDAGRGGTPDGSNEP